GWCVVLSFAKWKEHLSSIVIACVEIGDKRLDASVLGPPGCGRSSTDHAPPCRQRVDIPHRAACLHRTSRVFHMATHRGRGRVTRLWSRTLTTVEPGHVRARTLMRLVSSAIWL